LRSELDQVAAMARLRLGEDTFRAAVAHCATTPITRLADETLAWVESYDRTPSTPHATPGDLSLRTRLSAGPSSTSTRLSCLTRKFA
jgi:hypothetical protein